MDKEDEDDDTSMDCCLAIKKNEILPFAMTRMDREGIRLCEISQTEKDK